jgi:hypothetical protein
LSSQSYQAPTGRLFLEEQAVLQIPAGVELLVQARLEPGKVDAEIAQQLQGYAIPAALRRVDRLRAAVADQQRAVDVELVAFRMTAEVVIGVEYQDAGRRPVLTVEMRRRQAAEARAHHDQVVAFAHRDAARIEGPAVAHAVCRLEGADVAAAQAAAQGRVQCVRGAGLGGIGHRRRCAGRLDVGHSGDRHGDAVDEVAPADSVCHGLWNVTL